MINNYSKWRWIFAELRCSEVNVYHSSPTLRRIIVLVYNKPVDSQHQIVPSFLLRTGEKLACEIRNNAGR